MLMEEMTEGKAKQLCQEQQGWKESRKELMGQEPPIPIPSEKKAQGVVQPLAVLGSGRWLKPQWGSDQDTQAADQASSTAFLLFSTSLGGHQLLQHLCTPQHNEPLSGAFTCSSTKAQGSHRQEPWRCNTIVLSQVTSAKNKLLLNNLQTHFHQMLQGGHPSRALTQSTNNFRNSEEFYFFVSLLRVNPPKPSPDPLSQSSTLEHFWLLHKLYFNVKAFISLLSSLQASYGCPGGQIPTWGQEQPSPLL